ncbi:MAG TPA: ABC transporter ATP-binding protein [Mycobacteriales bacterium]|nr:ABC transporter ATP-binding protein [Mycobacteriales bacterium]
MSAQRRSSYRSLWRLRTYTRPYLVGLAAMTVAALVSELAPVAVPLIAQRVVDDALVTRDRGALLPLSLLALGLGVLEAIAILVRRWVMTRSALGLETDLRRDLYAHLQRLPVAFHDRWQSGQLLSRATGDLSTIRRFIGFGLVFLVVNTATCLVVGTMLAVSYWPLALFVLVSAVPLSLATLRFERVYAVAARRAQDLNGELTTNVEEAAGGIRTVKSFGRRRLVLSRFLDQARTLRDAELVKIRVLAFFWAVLEVHPQVVLAVVVLGGAVAVAHGALTLGGLVAFVALFLLLQWPIISLGWLVAQAQEAETAAERVYEVLDAPPTVVDRPGAMPLPRVTGRLRLDRVGFTYPDADRAVLHDVSLELAPGETVAVVGATGSGKTTLTALVTRLYDVTEGQVLLDGRDVRDIPLSQLRQVVATAFEDPTLFSVSARENLTLGRPAATDAEVAEALRIAQAEFVHDLPWGLDTRLGEQGLTLSGGQRQRLALARAVLGRPRVLVLDDPLSALDVHTEALVEEALRAILRDTTALVVAHRASTVLLADRVALLAGGTVAAVGTHSQLLATVPLYRDLLAQESDLEVEEVAS